MAKSQTNELSLRIRNPEMKLLARATWFVSQSSTKVLSVDLLSQNLHFVLSWNGWNQNSKPFTKWNLRLQIMTWKLTQKFTSLVCLLPHKTTLTLAEDTFILLDALGMSYSRIVMISHCNCAEIEKPWLESELDPKIIVEIGYASCLAQYFTHWIVQEAAVYWLLSRSYWATVDAISQPISIPKLVLQRSWPLN